MRKIYCDWCRGDATHNHLGGQFQRRISADKDQHKANLLIKVEFLSVDDQPDDLCESCLKALLLSAAERLPLPVCAPED